MPERSIIFRITSETAKLYSDYREKWIPKQVSDSQIVRAGLATLMAMPDAVINDEMDKLQKVNDQIVAQMKKIIKKHPEPQLYELWIELMENMNKIVALIEKSAEKYSIIVGEGKKGRKPNPKKKHTPGRLKKHDLGYEK